MKTQSTLLVLLAIVTSWTARAAPVAFSYAPGGSAPVELTEAITVTMPDSIVSSISREALSASPTASSTPAEAPVAATDLAPMVELLPLVKESPAVEPTPAVVEASPGLQQSPEAAPDFGATTASVVYTAVPTSFAPRSPSPLPKSAGTTVAVSPLPRASPGATPTPTPSESRRRSCFPADAVVRLADGSQISVSQLQVGDHVEVSPGVFSTVLLFTHADPASRSEMVIIATRSARIAVSPGHYLPVNGHLTAARDVRPGDSLQVYVYGNLKPLPVLSVIRSSMLGLYNPQTASGSILVRGRSGGFVLASVYTDAVDPPMAHAAIAPLRALHRAVGYTLPHLSTLFSGCANISIGSNYFRAAVISALRADRWRNPSSSLF